MDSYLLRIGTERRDSGEAEVIRSPFDDQPVAEVCVARREDMEDAIERAVAGFETMRSLPTHRRNRPCRSHRGRRDVHADDFIRRCRQRPSSRCQGRR